MQTRTFTTATGSTNVSALCLGAMYFGTRTDPETSKAILDRFVDAGGTFLDTADSYNQWFGRGGESEQLLGEWLRGRNDRDDLFIATKCGAGMMAGEDPDDNWEGLSAPAIEKAAKVALDRLGLEHIDLFYAHVDDRETPIEETVDALGSLVSDGTVGAIGCSNLATWRLERARAHASRAGTSPYTVIQQEFTYLWPKPVHDRLSAANEELRDYMRVHPDMTLTAYSPLLGGAYGYANRALPADRGYAHPSAYQRLQTLREVAGELGATPNQVVLAWLLRQPAVIPVFGASSIAQLDEALAAVDLVLEDEVFARLNAA